MVSTGSTSHECNLAFLWVAVAVVVASFVMQAEGVAALDVTNSSIIESFINCTSDVEEALLSFPLTLQDAYVWPPLSLNLIINSTSNRSTADEDVDEQVWLRVWYNCTNHTSSSNSSSSSTSNMTTEMPIVINCSRILWNQSQQQNSANSTATTIHIQVILTSYWMFRGDIWLDACAGTHDNNMTSSNVSNYNNATTTRFNISVYVMDSYGPTNPAPVPNIYPTSTSRLPLYLSLILDSNVTLNSTTQPLISAAASSSSPVVGLSSGSVVEIVLWSPWTMLYAQNALIVNLLNAHVEGELTLRWSGSGQLTATSAPDGLCRLYANHSQSQNGVVDIHLNIVQLNSFQLLNGSVFFNTRSVKGYIPSNNNQSNSLSATNITLSMISVSRATVVDGSVVIGLDDAVFSAILVEIFNVARLSINRSSSLLSSLQSNASAIMPASPPGQWVSLHIGDHTAVVVNASSRLISRLREASWRAIDVQIVGLSTEVTLTNYSSMIDRPMWTPWDTSSSGTPPPSSQPLLVDDVSLIVVSASWKMADQSTLLTDYFLRFGPSYDRWHVSIYQSTVDMRFSSKLSLTNKTFVSLTLLVTHYSSVTLSDESMIFQSGAFTNSKISFTDYTTLDVQRNANVLVVATTEFTNATIRIGDDSMMLLANLARLLASSANTTLRDVSIVIDNRALVDVSLDSALLAFGSGQASNVQTLVSRNSAVSVALMSRMLAVEGSNISFFSTIVDGDSAVGLLNSSSWLSFYSVVVNAPPQADTVGLTFLVSNRSTVSVSRSSTVLIGTGSVVNVTCEVTGNSTVIAGPVATFFVFQGNVSNASLRLQDSRLQATDQSTFIATKSMQNVTFSIIGSNVTASKGVPSFLFVSNGSTQDMTITITKRSKLLIADGGNFHQHSGGYLSRITLRAESSLISLDSFSTGWYVLQPIAYISFYFQDTNLTLASTSRLLFCTSSVTTMESIHDGGVLDLGANCGLGIVGADMVGVTFTTTRLILAAQQSGIWYAGRSVFNLTVSLQTGTVMRLDQSIFVYFTTDIVSTRIVVQNTSLTCVNGTALLQPISNNYTTGNMSDVILEFSNGTLLVVSLCNLVEARTIDRMQVLVSGGNTSVNIANGGTLIRCENMTNLQVNLLHQASVQLDTNTNLVQSVSGALMGGTFRFTNASALRAQRQSYVVNIVGVMSGVNFVVESTPLILLYASLLLFLNGTILDQECNLTANSNTVMAVGSESTVLYFITPDMPNQPVSATLVLRVSFTGGSSVLLSSYSKFVQMSPPLSSLNAKMATLMWNVTGPNTTINAEANSVVIYYPSGRLSIVAVVAGNGSSLSCNAGSAFIATGTVVNSSFSFSQGALVVFRLSSNLMLVTNGSLSNIVVQISSGSIVSVRDSPMTQCLNTGPLGTTAPTLLVFEAINMSIIIQDKGTQVVFSNARMFDGYSGLMTDVSLRVTLDSSLGLFYGGRLMSFNLSTNVTRMDVTIDRGGILGAYNFSGFYSQDQ